MSLKLIATQLINIGGCLPCFEHVSLVKSFIINMLKFSTRYTMLKTDHSEGKQIILLLHTSQRTKKCNHNLKVITKKVEHKVTLQNSKCRGIEVNG
jgi:hypothetical protein